LLGRGALLGGINEVVEDLIRALGDGFRDA
jgi:hypothetical protein